MPGILMIQMRGSVCHAWDIDDIDAWISLSWLDIDDIDH